jgi:UDP-sugar transporter A1/2/3
VYFSTLILAKHIDRRRWALLLGILIGIIIIQSSQSLTLPHVAKISPGSLKMSKTAAASLAGPILVLMAAACFAALAGVLLEKTVIADDNNLWVTNIHLSTFSLLPSLFIVLVEMKNADHPLDPLSTFFSNPWPWSAVIINVSGGLLVAITTKYAGSIANTMSGIASIAFTHLFETVSFLYRSCLCGHLLMSVLYQWRQGKEGGTAYGRESIGCTNRKGAFVDVVRCT